MDLSDLLDEDDVNTIVAAGKDAKASVETVKQGEKLGLLVDPKFFRGAISGLGLAIVVVFVYLKYMKGESEFRGAENRLNRSPRQNMGGTRLLMPPQEERYGGAMQDNPVENTMGEVNESLDNVLAKLRSRNDSNPSTGRLEL